MDDPNITMEEYIRLEEEKARRHGKIYNWETATYGRIWDDDEVHNLRSVETKFLAIVFDDTFTSQATLSFEPTVSPLNDNEIDVKISFHESDDEDYTPTVSYFDDLDYLKDFENEFPAIVYNDALTSKSDFLTEPTVNPQHIDEFNETSLSVYDEEEQNEKLVSKNGYDVFDMTLPPRDRDISILGLRVWSIQGLIDLMAEGLSARMLMEHKDAQGQSVFTNRAWKRLFEVRGPLVHELILDVFSTFRFGEAVLDLDTAGALQFQLGGVESASQILDKGDLSAYLVGISYAGDFLGTSPSYTSIRDLRLKLCHRLIACSISGRSHAPEKVTMTDLFYLRGMDVGSVNIPFLLDRYLRMFASGRKRGAMISRGRFVAVTGALEATEGAPDVDEGEKVVPAPVQAPQPPPATGPARTMAQRLGRLEEDVHVLQGALGEQREVLDNITRDFFRFTTWTVIGLLRMMDQAGVTYSSYADFQIPYVRRTRRRTDDAITSVPQQPDP
ncbi:hypothetical protein Tco_0612956 [Tanacetum coccineum]